VDSRSWGITGFVAALVPWSFLLLASLNVLVLPCRSVETAGVMALCWISVFVALFASLAGLRRWSAPAWAIAGLVLALTFGFFLILSEPAATGVFAIPAVAVGCTISQWR
jgi:hypothetical protein